MAQQPKHAWTPRFFVAALAAALAACGGGGGDSPEAPNPEAPARTDVVVKVVDGPLANAVVCLDVNGNAACDADEPRAVTSASGSATLSILAADAGRFSLVAEVGTDAVDADHGPVTQAYTLRTPADRPGLISPLTTLVQAYAQNRGVGSETAALVVEQELSLGLSAFADFTQGSSEAHIVAGTVARLLVVVTQAQRAALADAKDSQGVTLATPRIDAAINLRLLQQLPDVAQAVSDSTELTTGDAKARADAFAAVGDRLAEESGLTQSNVAWVADTPMAGAAPVDVSSGVASKWLRWFSYTDSNNYLVRQTQSTAAQNTPDSSGLRRFQDVRTRSVNGALQSWGGTEWYRTALFWTGSSWLDCQTTFEHTFGIDATTGTVNTVYCNSERSVGQRKDIDVSGRSVLDLVRQIRAYPLADSAGEFANWGPNPEDQAVRTALAGASFPAGSVLRLQTVQITQPLEYYERLQRATIPSPNDPDNPNGSTWIPASLDEFVKHNRGNFDPSITDVHGNNARVLLNRDYITAAGASAYKRYMVAFDERTKRTRFFECEGDMVPYNLNGARRTLYINGRSTCKSILESTYSVAPRGTGGQVLQFAQQPFQLSTTVDHLFVERAGVMYVGYKDKPRTSYQQRLNGTASDTLLNALRIGASAPR